MRRAIAALGLILIAGSLSGCSAAALAGMAAFSSTYVAVTPFFTYADDGLVGACLAYELKVSAAKASTVGSVAAEKVSGVVIYGETACHSIALGNKPNGDPVQTVFWLGQQGVLAELAARGQ